MANDAFPKISIIVASYNNEETIGECLKSILALDYPSDSFEVIVMDGCSIDKTVEIAQKLSRKSVITAFKLPRSL